MSAIIMILMLITLVTGIVRLVLFIRKVIRKCFRRKTKRNKTVEISKNIVKGGVKTAKIAYRTTKTTVKILLLILKILRVIISVILSSTILIYLVVIVFVVVSVLSAVNVIFSDKVEYTSNYEYAYRTQLMYDSIAESAVTSLEKLDQSVLNFKMGSSAHTVNISTNVKRSDFSVLANLLTSGDASIQNVNGKSASKYVGYIYGDFHSLTHKMKVYSYEGYLPSRPTESILKSNSIVVDELKAGILYKDDFTIFMDCSGFIAWFWATLFVSVDGSNSDIRDLANWFTYCSSGSDFTSYYKCDKVQFEDIKAGDILVRRKNGSGHIGIYIGDGKYIHSSSSGTGVFISTIVDGNFATSSGFYANNSVYGNSYAYRPRIIFADD